MAKEKDNEVISDEERKACIPKLPQGQGTITWLSDRGKYSYKKTVNGKRRVVYAVTVKEVMAMMNRLEKEGCKEAKHQEKITLAEAMLDWLEKYKRPKLKRTSYDTLRKTIMARIADYDIGSTRLSAIDSDMIQEHLNMLNESMHLSYSTIKKCYDALNDFYRNRTLQGKVGINPMLTVGMVNKENIIRKTKKIEFFERDDIEKFIQEATAIFTWSRQPKYQYGFCLCANIYLGMRAGELLALRWEDVDFEKGSIYVHENLQLVSNRNGTPKQVYETQSLKNYQNRHIHMNQRARYFLECQREYSQYTNPCDYVCCTQNGTHAAVSYLSGNIKRIEETAGTTVTAHGTHVIRHTCASLYFRNGVRVELIAALLGHSVDVCRSTYIHFVEEQKKAAVELIDDYEVS